MRVKTGGYGAGRCYRQTRRFLHSDLTHLLPRAALAATCTLGPAMPAALADEDAAAIETLVVSATRFERDASGIAGSISQVPADTIDLVGHVHVQELLLRVPGVNLHRGNGQEYLPAIRSPVLSGAGACGGILTAEDGIPLRAAGFCNINELFEAHTEQARRIEVIQGPGTALYGSNALHGVVNVITPGVPEDYRSAIGIDAGPDDFRRLKLAAGRRGDDWGLGLNLTATHDDGFRDDAGYDQQKLTLRYQYSGERLSLDVGLSYSNLNQETAGFIEGRNAYKSRSISESNANPEAFRDARAVRLWSRLEYSLDDGSRLQITPYLRYTDMDFLQHFLPGDPLEQNGQKSLGLLSAYAFQAGAGLQLIAGVDAEFSQGFLQQDQDGPTAGSAFLRETIPEGNHYDYEVDATNVAPFLHLDWEIDPRFSLSAGVRYESMRYDYDNLALDGRSRDDGTSCGFGGCRYSRPADREDSFDNWSPKLGLSYRFSPQQSAYVNLSRGFRAPQATELYRLQRAQTVADLDSEHLDSIEVGVKGSGDKFVYQLAAFAMQKDNVIFRDSDFFNVSDGQTTHRGLEAQLSYRFSPVLDAGINANLVRHQYDYRQILNDINIDGNDVDTAPRYFGTAQLGWQPLPAARLELEWVYVGPYYLEPENLHEYSGHSLFNLRANWSPNPRLGLFARLTNLSNRKYAERADFTSFTQERYFPGTPRTLVLGAQWRWL